MHRRVRIYNHTGHNIISPFVDLTPIPSLELTNYHLYQELQKSTGKSTTVPHAQIIQEQGSVEYDEPIVTTRKLAPPPPVFPKPSKNSQPPLSPPTSPHYHTLDPHNVSPLLLPRDSPRNSPQFPAAPAHLSPVSPFSDAPLSTLGQRSLQSSIPINPFASLDRRRILHSREHSNTSEYDVIENTSRTMSEGSSHVGGHSRTTSQATTCDDEPIDHVYQELTSEVVRKKTCTQLYNNVTTNIVIRPVLCLSRDTPDCIEEEYGFPLR